MRYLKTTNVATSFKECLTFKNSRDGTSNCVIHKDHPDAEAAKNAVYKIEQKAVRKAFPLPNIRCFKDITPKTIVKKLKENRIRVGWHFYVSTGVVELCSNTAKNVQKAYDVMKQLGLDSVVPPSPHTMHQEASSSPCMEQKVFSDKLSCGIERLGYFKTLKLGKETEQVFRVSITVDLSSRCLMVEGQSTKVFEAIEHLNTRIKKFVTKRYAKPKIFVKCLRMIQKSEVITALRADQVKAGWNVMNDQILVCGDNEDSVERAFATIEKLVVEFDYPETTLSQAEIKGTETSSQWSLLLKKLVKKNIQVEVDYSTSKVVVAMAASENKMAVKSQLDQFFAPASQISHSIPLSAVGEQLFTLNLDYITSACQPQDNETVTVSIENQSCCLTSLASSSLSVARQNVERILANMCVQIKNVEPRALSAWLLTEPAKSRVKEIAYICHVIIDTSQQSISNITGSSAAIKNHSLTTNEADISKLLVSSLAVGQCILEPLFCNTKH